MNIIMTAGMDCDDFYSIYISFIISVATLNAYDYQFVK